MHRKHYVLIAQAIRKMRRQHGDRYGFIAAVAENVADVLAADNPRFDRGRFLAACEEAR
jgi:predicted nucleic acid-binding protein